jgi:hypothetical protein
MDDIDVISAQLAAMLPGLAREANTITERPRAQKMLTHNGVTMARRAWAAQAGINESVLIKRLSRGMSMEEALHREVGKYTGGRKIEDTVRAMKNAPCKDCCVKYHFSAMEFDHVRGDKLFDISKHKHYGKDKVLAEIAKCDLVCANCHRIRTHLRRST